MSDEQRAELTTERQSLTRKLKKREGESGFASNVEAIKARLAEIDALLADG